MRSEDVRLALGAVISEVDRADALYGDFASSHEGFGVLAEEVAELLEAIHANDALSVSAEALQVAAVALRISLGCSQKSFKVRSGMSKRD